MPDRANAKTDPETVPVLRGWLWRLAGWGVSLLLLAALLITPLVLARQGVPT